MICSSSLTVADPSRLGRMRGILSDIGRRVLSESPECGVGDRPCVTVHTGVVAF